MGIACPMLRPLVYPISQTFVAGGRDADTRACMRGGGRSGSSRAGSVERGRPTAETCEGRGLLAGVLDALRVGLRAREHGRAPDHRQMLASRRYPDMPRM